MNYIRHLNTALDKLIADHNLNPTHVSLYIVLFRIWNIKRFQNPITISRLDAMESSKIASRSTYFKCIKELDKYGYIDYVPSKNPFIGSLVHMTVYCTSTGQALDNSQTNNRTSPEQVVDPYINSNKPIKHKRKNSHVNNFKDYSEPL